MWHIRHQNADLLDYFHSLGNACKLLLSEICALGTCHASYKRCQRALLFRLKQVRTYLRPTTEEARLSHLMFLHVHEELANGTA